MTTPIVTEAGTRPRFTLTFTEADESEPYVLEFPGFWLVSVRRTDDGAADGLTFKWRAPGAAREYEKPLVEGDEGGEWTLEVLRGPAEIVLEADAAMTVDVMLEPVRPCG